MVKNKKTPTAPKWLKKNPEGRKKELIHDHTYGYLSTLALKGETFKVASEYITPIMAYLGDDNQDIAKVKTSFHRTTFKFIEYLRTHIKNTIAKIEREKQKKTMIPPNDSQGQHPVDIKPQEILPPNMVPQEPQVNTEPEKTDLKIQDQEEEPGEEEGGESE